jgi:hypothetical protein
MKTTFPKGRLENKFHKVQLWKLFEHPIFQYASLFMLDVITTLEKSGDKLHEPLTLTPDGGELSDSRSGLSNS